MDAAFHLSSRQGTVFQPGVDGETGRHGQKQLIDKRGRDGKRIVLPGLAQKRDVEPLVAEHLLQLIRAGLGDLQADAGIKLAKTVQHRRQHARDDVAGRADTNAAGKHRSKIEQLIAQLALKPFHLTDLFDVDSAGLRQTQRLGAAVKERHPDLALDLGNGDGKRRLRHEQLARRLGKAAFAIDRLDVFQLVLHRSFSSR